MGSRGATVVKLRMTPYFWRLLGKYCIVLSCQTMARGGGRMSLTSTVTGIVASHLGRHAQWIEDEFAKIIREVSAQASGYSADYVDAVASASSAEIPNVVRAGTSPKRLERLLKRARPLLQFGGPSRGDAGRSAAGPRKVRVRGGGASSAARGGGEDPQPPVTGGDGAPGSGDLGPQPELLKKAIRDFGKFLETDEAKAVIEEIDRQRAAE